MNPLAFDPARVEFRHRFWANYEWGSCEEAVYPTPAGTLRTPVFNGTTRGAAIELLQEGFNGLVARLTNHQRMEWFASRGQSWVDEPVQWGVLGWIKGGAA